MLLIPTVPTGLALLDHTHIQVVDGQEGLRFGSFSLDEMDTVTSDFLCGDHNGVHVAAKHFCDGELELLVDGTTQVRQTAILPPKIQINTD